RVFNQLKELPGIRSVSLTSCGLLDVCRSQSGHRTDRPNPDESHVSTWQADILYIGPQYFETVGLPLIAGVDFTPDNREMQVNRVAIVNQTFSAAYFPGKDPVGRYFDAGSGEVEIIAVAQDAKYLSLREEKRPVVYYPYSEKNGSQPPRS